MSRRAKAIAKVLGGTDNPDRWMAEIIFRDGTRRTLAIEELEDLDEIVEQGPDWNTIDQIVITLNRPTLSHKEGK